MPTKKKPLDQWEIELGFLVREPKKHDMKKMLTLEEAVEIGQVDGHGVDHPVRIKFLRDNGYKVTHANMIDPALSAKPTEEPTDG